MGVLANADVLAATLHFLTDHPAVITARGAGRVGGINAPPYPCIVVTEVDSDDRDLRWQVVTLVQVEVLGDLNGTPGKAALRGLAYTAAEALTELPLAGSVDGVVVTEVGSAAGVRWAPLENRQGRYVTTIRLAWHPART